VGYAKYPAEGHALERPDPLRPCMGSASHYPQTANDEIVAAADDGKPRPRSKEHGIFSTSRHQGVYVGPSESGFSLQALVAEARPATRPEIPEDLRKEDVKERGQAQALSRQSHAQGARLSEQCAPSAYGLQARSTLFQRERPMDDLRQVADRSD